MRQNIGTHGSSSASPSTLADASLAELLREDVPYGDRTTEALGIGDVQGSLSFVARRAMVVCGTEEAARLFQLCGGEAHVEARTGARVAPQARLLRARGHAEGLLRAWKVAQNIVEWASGIATAAEGLVAAVREAGFDIPVACTRKAFPGTRQLAVKAVVAGGATLHRAGLSESILVFPEHRAFFTNLEESWLDALKLRERERRVTVEVTDLEQALALAKRGVEALQLEHFSAAEVAECRARLDSLGLRPLLLVAGGVTALNAAALARAGADVLVSSAPYQAPPADVQVLVRKLPTDEV